MATAASKKMPLTAILRLVGICRRYIIGTGRAMMKTSVITSLVTRLNSSSNVLTHLVERSMTELHIADQFPLHANSMAKKKAIVHADTMMISPVVAMLNHVLLPVVKIRRQKNRKLNLTHPRASTWIICNVHSTCSVSVVLIFIHLSLPCTHLGGDCDGGVGFGQ